MDGMKPIKRVEFRFFSADYKESRVQRFRAENGTGWTPEGVEHLKLKLIDGLTDRFPEYKFVIVQVGKNQYNVLHTVGNA